MLLYSINILNIIFFILFILPIFVGAYKSFSRDKIEASMLTFFEGIEYLSAMILSFLLTKWIFFSNIGFFKIIKTIIPDSWKNFLESQEVLTYIICTPILAFIILVIFRFALAPLYQGFIIPLSDNVKRKVEKAAPVSQTLVFGFYQIPKSIFVVVVYTILLSTFSYYNFVPAMSSYMSSSIIYQSVYKTTVSHLLSPNMSKEVAIINDKDYLKNNENGNALALRMGQELDDEGINLEDYLNGETLKEVVQSNSEIDTKAVELTEGESESRKKAELIYNWIVKNIEFDADKTEKLSNDPKGISSSAIICFSTKKGGAFDYATLYVAMCKAVNVKVRFVTGLAFNGTAWGTHCWNQVQVEDDTWIMVDVMFGKDSNYFDKKEFFIDHTDGEIRGEW
jgi:hypothetical protein